MSHWFLCCLRHHLVKVVSACFLIPPLAYNMFYIYVSAPPYSVRDHLPPHHLTVLVAQPEIPNNHLIGRVPFPQRSHDEGIEEHAIPQMVIMLRQGAYFFFFCSCHEAWNAAYLFSYVIVRSTIVTVLLASSTATRSGRRATSIPGIPWLTLTSVEAGTFKAFTSLSCMALYRLVVDVKLDLQCHRTWGSVSLA